MNQLNPRKVGLALGGFIALGHLVWALLVALSWAQPFINWVLGLHMIQGSVTVLPFSWASAITLLIVSAAVGYVFGFIFAKIWNKVHR